MPNNSSDCDENVPSDSAKKILKSIDLDEFLNSKYWPAHANQVWVPGIVGP